MKRILFLCSMLVAASLSGGLLQAQSVEELKAAAMLYDMDSCTFSSSIVTVDGFRYKLDATKHLARFVYFNKTDVAPETLVIPETITYNDDVYVVVATEGYYSYSQNNTKKVVLPSTIRWIGDYTFYPFKSMTQFVIPENVEYIKGAIIDRDNVSFIFKGTVPPQVSGRLSSANNKIKLYVPGESLKDYVITDYIEDCCVIADDISYGTVVIDSVDNGELGYIVVADALPKVRVYAEVNKLIVKTGNIDETDWYQLRQMHNLVYLDLSGLSISDIPYQALSDCWQIETVILPDTLKAIRGYAFYRTGINNIIIPPSVRNITGDDIFYNCDSLQSIAIPEGVTSLPYQCFYSCDRLESVSLPSTLSSISSDCFEYCNLKTLHLPGALSYISSYCFRGNNNLAKVEFEEGLRTVGYYSFSGCAIDTLIFPSTLKTIDSYAFSGNTALKGVSFNEGLEEIDNYAFNNCSRMKAITLPSSLQFCLGRPFSGCSSLKKIESRALIPPTVRADIPTNSAGNIELYVPLWSFQEYMTTPGWLEYQNHTNIIRDNLPANIVINKEFEFVLGADDNVEGYTPNVRLLYNTERIDDGFGHQKYERGNLTVSSRSKLALNDFSMYVSPYAKYYADYSRFYYNNKYTYDYNSTKYNPNSLIVRGEMRAENQTLNMMLYNDLWQFISFPFDVKVSDIVPVDSKTQWVIRKYSGYERAQKNFDKTWVNLTADSILQAGRGYIMKCYNNTADNNDYVVEFTVTPIKESVTRQYLFTSKDREVALEENLSEFEQNRSWNLIGNPYPCYFDTRFIDTESPFMVWDSYNRTYVAFSPVDDDYILNPGEAFFIQRPVDNENLLFLHDGRQTYRNPNNLTVEHSSVRGGSERKVMNLSLSFDTLSDRTRVVFNNKASMDYEVGRDMAKFISTEPGVPQIWTVCNGVQYSINERSEADGMVAVDLHCGASGTYTIGVADEQSEGLKLEDRLYGTTTVLTLTSGYTFSASEGDVTGRFFISNAETTDVDAKTAPVQDKVFYNAAGQFVDGNSEGITISDGVKTLNR